MKVAIAIICDDKRNLLITQRPLHVAQGGLWEFPGGKLESNETAEIALVREIKEELGLDLIQYQYIGEMMHQYADRKVQLIIFLVTQFNGIAACQEGQQNMKWIVPDDLNPVDFPEANRKIIDWIKGDTYRLESMLGLGPTYNSGLL